MDLSFGSSNIAPVTPVATSVNAVEAKAEVAAPVVPKSMFIAAQIAQNVLIPLAATLAQIQFVSIRRAVIPPPPRSTTPDRDEKKRGEFLRKIKVAKGQSLNLTK